jgi:hypothetical protein
MRKGGEGKHKEVHAGLVFTGMSSDQITTALLDHKSPSRT